MSVNISAAFKQDERVNNGLEVIEKDLIESPLDRHVVVGVVECIRITKDVADGGTETPTVRIIQIEPMLSQADEKAARKLLDKAYKARTGGAPQGDLFSHNADGEGEGDD